MSLPLDYKLLTIPAGSVASPGTVKSQLGGVFFFCASATSAFQMQFDAGTVFPANANFRISNANTKNGSFGTITFYNTSANAITVAFYVGQAAVDYVFGGTVREASSRNLGGGIVALGAGATLSVPGSNNGSQRKQIIVTNLDANNPVYIQDSGGNIMGAVFAQTPWTVASDAVFILKNTTANPINVIVGETYYN